MNTRLAHDFIEGEWLNFAPFLGNFQVPLQVVGRIHDLISSFLPCFHISVSPFSSYVPAFRSIGDLKMVVLFQGKWI